MPVAVLTQLVEGDVYHWGSLMAGTLLGSIPVAIFYSFFVEYYVFTISSLQRCAEYPNRQGASLISLLDN